MEPDKRLVDITDCLFRVAAKAFVIRDNKLLLVRDDPEDSWAFPGGGIDYGESAEDALVRELAEELHVDPTSVSSDFKVVAVNSGHIKSGIPRVNIYYRADVSDAHLGNSGDIVELRWFDKNELETIDFDKSNGDSSKLVRIAQDFLS